MLKEGAAPHLQLLPQSIPKEIAKKSVKSVRHQTEIRNQSPQYENLNRYVQ
jgi:hypothetical protein